MSNNLSIPTQEMWFVYIMRRFDENKSNVPKYSKSVNPSDVA